MSRSGATGTRLKETQAINKSLSCLADVFAAIGKKSPHVRMKNIKILHRAVDTISQLKVDVFIAELPLWRWQNVNDGKICWTIIVASSILTFIG